MIGICLVAGAARAFVAATGFTLAWDHSIEKTRWEEDYVIEGGRLRAAEARIVGTGAGMEPPPQARFADGVWHYRPALPALESLRLTHSPYTKGYELCLQGRCEALAQRLPGLDNAAVIEVTVCHR